MTVVGEEGMAGEEGAWRDVLKKIRLESWTGQIEAFEFHEPHRSARHTGKGVDPDGQLSYLDGERNPVRVAKEHLWPWCGQSGQ